MKAKEIVRQLIAMIPRQAREIKLIILRSILYYYPTERSEEINNALSDLIICVDDVQGILWLDEEILILVFENTLFCLKGNDLIVTGVE